MANKWAIQNGNWSDDSTWNDGVVPTDADDVWLNGKTINMLNNDVLQARKISNYANPEISVTQGGYIIGINAVANYIINADIYCGVNYILRRFYGNFNDASYSLQINGNIYCEEGVYLAISDMYSYYWLYINGNVSGGLFTNTHKSSRQRIFVNGNVSDNDTTLFLGTVNHLEGMFTYEQSGILTLHKSFNIGLRANTYVINGKVKLVGNEATLNCQTYNNENYSFEISGELDIRESTATNLLSVLNGSIKTLNGFNITSESNNIPPESVVLEGYEYGDKVGTLKTVPDNVAIVNLTEQQLQRVGNCATVSTVQKCFEEFKE